MDKANHNPVIVLGASGQVGGALAALLGDRAVALTRAEVDLADLSGLAGALDKFKPAAVINGAAYTQVDAAEKEKDLSMAVNGEAPGVIARWCAERCIPFVHFSTDYVFSGAGERPWTEEDQVAPVNHYGLSKLEGERQVAGAGGKYLVFRTSWVYDAAGKNFLTTMLRLGREREELSVVGDQYGAPTYARHLAEATLQAFDMAMSLPAFPAGIYHLCNRSETSWYGFAEAIFQAARGKGMSLKVRSLKAIPASDYPVPARRPSNSRLNTNKALRAFGISLPEWNVGLNDCLNNCHESN
jgi:dTDP-4-dehydrorhamnose reductase